MNTTIKQLVIELGELSQIPTSKEQAIKENKSYYLFCEHASVYGGYRLVRVNVSSGGHAGIFGGSSVEGRINAKDMIIKLNALIQGIIYAKDLELVSNL